MLLSIRVFGVPLIFMGLAFALLSVFERFSGSPHLGQMSAMFFYTACAAFAAALVLMTYNVIRVFLAWYGRSESCHRCAMPVSLKGGRHGLYYKCWGCGSTRSHR